MAGMRLALAVLLTLACALAACAREKAVAPRGPAPPGGDLDGRYEPEEGKAYWFDVDPRIPSDDEDHPDRSTLLLLEDGRRLGPPHALHDDIRTKGGGRYSHWKGRLYFSAGDGSDPNENGRLYTVSPPEASLDYLLRAVAPAVARAGEPFEARLLAIDPTPGGPYEDYRRGRLAFCEPAAACEPEEIRWRPGEGAPPPPLAFTPRAPGVLRVRVQDDLGRDARSNPVWVREADWGGTARPYFGDLHAHSALSSDAHGAPESLQRYARDAAGLDFVAMTDHNYSLTAKSWETLKRTAAAFHAPGRFLSFVGFEWSSQFGHRNVLFPDAAGRFIAKDDPADFTPDDLVAWLAGSGAVVVPAHAPTSWAPYQPGAREGAAPRAFEIASNHGRSEFFGNPNPLFYQTHSDQGPDYYPEEPPYQIPGRHAADVLEAGERLGFIGSSDDHSAMPGRGPIAAVWADALTREAVLAALAAGRSYATTNARMILDLRANGAPMGSRVLSEEPVAVEGLAVGTAPVERVELVRDGREVVASLAPKPEEAEGLATLRARIVPEARARAYYLRVSQTDGEMGWSSPVWIAAPRPALAIERLRYRPAAAGGAFAARVRSVGGAPARGVRALWSVDGVGRGERALGDLPDAAALAGDLGSLAPGDHALRVTVRAGEAEASADLAIRVPAESLHLWTPEAAPEDAGDAPHARHEATVETGEGEMTAALAGSATATGVVRNELVDEDLWIEIGEGESSRWAAGGSLRGSELLGGSDFLVYRAAVSPGEHRLRVMAEGAARPERLEVFFTPAPTAEAKRTASVLSDAAPAIPFGERFGLWAWRERASETGAVRLRIAWTMPERPAYPRSATKDYWCTGSLRLAGARRYAVSAEGFKDLRDRLEDDRAGALYWVARADRGGSLAVTILPEPGAAATLDFRVGGRRYPEEAFVGGRATEALPVRIPLAEE